MRTARPRIPNRAGPESGWRTVSGDLLAVGGWTAVGVLLAGTCVLLGSIEVLIRSLIRTSLHFGVSAFLLSIVFSGWEFDNIAVGLFTGFDGLQHVAFGLAIGNAMTIFGLTLALGALLVPFEVEVPRDYVLLMVVTPFLLVPVVLSGAFTPVVGLGFVALYVAIFAYLAYRESTRDVRFMRSEDVHEMITASDGHGSELTAISQWAADVRGYRWFWPTAMGLSIVGIVVGAEISSAGIDGIMTTWNLSGTFVGVTLVAVLYSLDDILLMVEPLRLGHPEIAVSGVIGSLLFFVTVNVGLVAMVGSVHFQAQTLYFHLPALLCFTVVSGILLWRGQLERWHGALLLVGYLLYLALAIFLFSQAPVSG